MQLAESGQDDLGKGRCITVNGPPLQGAVLLALQGTGLVHRVPENIQEYMTNNRLPRHPLVAKGFPSIGCAPCTTRVGEGEDPRAGRWRGKDKEECGIHFVDGKVVRSPLKETTS